ncbi:unnamed protein product [Tetraodon nigroviridis]|uniref:(spotted green pufferfish) hypothetical protein n=1 Tax=Tetraodon nigroviridis TaxID=99883 RepID=Q4RZE4_TETNG|nr:unnamed protein product [Tetraodon nigroviridis]
MLGCSVTLRVSNIQRYCKISPWSWLEVMKIFLTALCWQNKVLQQKDTGRVSTEGPFKDCRTAADMAFLMVQSCPPRSVKKWHSFLLLWLCHYMEVSTPIKQRREIKEAFESPGDSSGFDPKLSS